MAQYTVSTFIAKATEVHHGRYDYSDVVYVNAHTKVRIKCPDHGIFEQTPNIHLRGCGCPLCANERQSIRNLSDTSSFISKGIAIHGERYDYSRVKYVNVRHKVEILCPIHGSFLQAPSDHLAGCGCPKCGRATTREKKRDDTESFIKKAKSVHGKTYDYSHVEYVDSQTKVCIICPEHGPFWQTPNSHLTGHGCDKCADSRNGFNKRLTREMFISRSKAIHGDKYDYSKVNYTTSSQKVTIVCPVHGDFQMLADSHMSGRGCPKCAAEANGLRKRLPLTDFVRRASEIHKGKYDYSKVVYAGCEKHVRIICPEHGEFMQTPAKHLAGHGCPVCRYITGAKHKTFTTEKFIQISREVHGDKYDYSRTVYVKARKPVTIICPEHGEFTQNAMDHMSGQGCPICGRNKCDQARRNTTEEFIARAQEVHGDKYDYSRVEYTTNRTPVCIICPKHGTFNQTPHEHLSGSGCPKCRESVLEKELRNYFDAQGINYVYIKRFEWLGRQSLDFFLSDYNVAIECQGLQHYESSPGYMGGERGFHIRQGLDRRKLNLCHQNGIRLLYFDHTEYELFLGEKVYKSIDELYQAILEYNEPN